jgi:uncharacterized DUF497 family protein
MQYEWDGQKRLANLAKHGLDFEDAWLVHEHLNRLTSLTAYPYEQRFIDLAEVDGRVIALVYTLRGNHVRCISMRPAKRRERRVYYGEDR